MGACLGACLGTCLGVAQAQPHPFACMPLVASTTREPAYGPVQGQQRCEGFFERNVSTPFLEVVSLSRAAPGTWTADEHGQLLLLGSPRTDVRLVIQPLRTQPLYRVDAILARGAGLRWDSRTMLKATGLPLRDLGFLAIAPGEREPMALIPVSGPAIPAGNPAYAILRPSVSIGRINWRVQQPGGSAGPWHDIPGGTLFAWDRVVVPIPLPESGHGLRVDVQARDLEDQPLPLLQFDIFGPDDEAP